MREIEAKDFRRLFIVAAFLLLFFFFIIFQFYQLQIKEGAKWEKLAKGQHQFSVVEPYKRGRFIANSSFSKLSS